MRSAALAVGDAAMREAIAYYDGVLDFVTRDLFSAILTRLG